MNIGQTFKITYYAKKHGKHITRQGKWTEKCIERLDKLNNDIMIYFDMDADGYRTATKSWKVRY
jgi:single-stranded DNA-specific DHH superfamily exonuclease